MLTERVLKSLAELPAGTRVMASSWPGHAARAARKLAGPPARLAQQSLNAAGRQSQQVIKGLYGGTASVTRLIQPWSRGGLNE